MLEVLGHNFNQVGVVLSVGATTDLFHFTNGGVGYLTALERLNIVLYSIGVVVQGDCVCVWR